MLQDDLAGPIEVLKLLETVEFRSGEWIAQRLGISRAAVWKRITKLEELGVPVERVPATGYRLRIAIEVLDAALLKMRLPERVRTAISSIDVVGSVESTNLSLLESLRRGKLGHGTILLAEQQTAGRGRRGRTWVSPFGRNIYLSMVWQFDGGVAGLAGLSLAMGVAAARAMHAIDVPVTLKWPNDLLVGNAKIGGILIDLEGDFGGPIHAVIGIGVNFYMPAERGSEIEQPWTDIRTVCGEAVSRADAVVGLLANCVDALIVFGAQGFAPFREEWDGLDALRGKEIELRTAAGVEIGTGLGVDDSGALVLRQGKRLIAAHAGEASVRVCA